MSNWGGMKYRDHTPVPRAEDRCNEDRPDGHVCKLHTNHDGAHTCVCWKEWENEHA